MKCSGTGTRTRLRRLVWSTSSIASCRSVPLPKGGSSSSLMGSHILFRRTGARHFLALQAKPAMQHDDESDVRDVYGMCEMKMEQMHKGL